VTVIRQSTTVVTETWTIKCYGAMNLPLWLRFKGPCIRVLDDCHLWTFCLVVRPAGNRSGWKMVDCVWNVMAHSQKPDFFFRRNGRVHLNRRGASVQSTTGSRGVRISGSNAGYTIFRGCVKSTG